MPHMPHTRPGRRAWVRASSSSPRASQSRAQQRLEQAVVRFLADASRRVVGEVGAGDEQDPLAGAASCRQQPAEHRARLGVAAQTRADRQRHDARLRAGTRPAAAAGPRSNARPGGPRQSAAKDGPRAAISSARSRSTGRSAERRAPRAARPDAHSGGPGLVVRARPRRPWSGPSRRPAARPGPRSRPSRRGRHVGPAGRRGASRPGRLGRGTPPAASASSRATSLSSRSGSAG